jgi:CHAT domain-containing protein
MIMMSLWKVSDAATQRLMNEFYQNWHRKGMGKRQAFEAAQATLRKEYPEPYYWAAFVLIE